MDSLLCCKKQGICCWAKALERFQINEKSNLHRAAVSTVAATNVGLNVAASISAGKYKQMSDARTALLAILSIVQYLSCHPRKHR